MKNEELKSEATIELQKSMSALDEQGRLLGNQYAASLLKDAEGLIGRCFECGFDIFPNVSSHKLVMPVMLVTGTHLKIVPSPSVYCELECMMLNCDNIIQNHMISQYTIDVFYQSFREITTTEFWQRFDAAMKALRDQVEKFRPL